MVNGRALKSSLKADIFLLIIVLLTTERLKNEIRRDKKVRIIEEIMQVPVAWQDEEYTC